MCIYGYIRVSRPTQDPQRQVRNILAFEPKAKIISEIYTGGTQERPKWQKLISNLRENDTVIFDSVSRMSRNADEGFREYQMLFERGVNLVFLKERHIDTAAYRESMQRTIAANIETGNKSADTLINTILQALNDFMLDKVQADILKAFEQAQKELEDIHSRTSEGLKTAKLNGKRVGRQVGETVETSKAKKAKELILRHSIDFGGSLTDAELIKLCGVCRNTFYSYKRQLKN